MIAKDTLLSQTMEMNSIEDLETKLSLLMVNTEESFVLVDKSLSIITFNDQFQRTYSQFFQKNVVKGESILTYARPDRLELVKQIYEKVFLGEKQESEIAIPTPTKTLYYLIKYKPAYDENGKIFGAFVTTVDITEKKYAEEKLKQSEERFNLFMTFTPALAWLTDEDGYLFYANSAFIKLLNLNQSIIGKSIFEIFPPEIAKQMHLNNLEVIQNQTNLETTEMAPDAHGNLHSYSVYKFPIPNISGKRIIGGLAVDVTEKLESEKKLKANEERLRTIIENEPECVKVVDKKGNLLDMNTAGLRMIEANHLDEVKGQKVISLIHPEDQSIYLKTHLEACKGIKGASRFRIIGLKQTLRWMEMHCVPLKNPNGEIYAALSVTRDITKQIKAEEDKEFERRDKEALINSTQDRMWSVSNDYKLIAANNAFILSLKNAIGFLLKPGDNLLLNDYFPDEFISFWKRLYDRALAGEIYHEEIYIPSINESPEIWLDVSFNPISHNQTQSGIACYGRDITEIKNHQKKLIELNQKINLKVEELARSDQELEQFAYVASHDLQEPLRMVTGFLTQLDKKYKDNLDEKAKEYIHFAVDGASRMRRIIQNLLEYSRIEREQKFAPVSLNDIIKEILLLNQKSIEEKNANIHFEHLPTIYGSYTSLSQVFQNLIGNALKYHKTNVPPIVQISAKENESDWEIQITDNGIGIDPKFFKRIFVIFQRLHSEEDYSGSGIGLSICKKIIESHGGKIWVESELEKGSTFHFTISKNLKENENGKIG